LKSNFKFKDLSSNRLRLLKEGTFKALVNLEKLNMDNNQLEYILKDTFLGLENLTQLNLNKNNINFINVKAFKHLKKLIQTMQTNEFRLEENPIDKFQIIENIIQFY
jgi:hypothetical protein